MQLDDRPPHQLPLPHAGRILLAESLRKVPARKFLCVPCIGDHCRHAEELVRRARVDLVRNLHAGFFQGRGQHVAVAGRGGTIDDPRGY